MTFNAPVRLGAPPAPEMSDAERIAAILRHLAEAQKLSWRDPSLQILTSFIRAALNQADVIMAARARPGAGGAQAGAS